MDFNKRLDEILSKHGAESGEFTYSLEHDLTQLFRDMVKEAKPKRAFSHQWWNDAIDEFESNLLKMIGADR